MSEQSRAFHDSCCAGQLPVRSLCKRCHAMCLPELKIGAEAPRRMTRLSRLSSVSSCLLHPRKYGTRRRHSDSDRVRLSETYSMSAGSGSDLWSTLTKATIDISRVGRNPRGSTSNIATLRVLAQRRGQALEERSSMMNTRMAIQQLYHHATWPQRESSLHRKYHNASPSHPF